MEAATPPKEPTKEPAPTEEEKESEGQKYDGGEIPRVSPEETKKG